MVGDGVEMAVIVDQHEIVFDALRCNQEIVEGNGNAFFLQEKSVAAGSDKSRSFEFQDMKSIHRERKKLFFFLRPRSDHQFGNNDPVDKYTVFSNKILDKIRHCRGRAPEILDPNARIDEIGAGRIRYLQFSHALAAEDFFQADGILRKIGRFIVLDYWSRPAIS